jgi:hypothetical protein
VSIIEKGRKFTTLIEERDIAYFPGVVEWTHEASQASLLLGWLGSAVKWFGATASFSTLFRLADPILPFWTWRWTSLD